MHDKHHSSVDFWLSGLPHKDSQPLLDGLPSPSPSAHSLPTLHSPQAQGSLPSPNSSCAALGAKRKRSEEDEVAICKRLRPGQPLTRQALRSISGNMGDTSKQNQARDQVRSVPRVALHR